MGWRPHEVYRVTVCEFEAAWDGWRNVHCGPSTESQFATREDFDDLLEFARDKYGFT